MNCSAFEKELEHLVETRGESLPESVAAHVGTCDACHALYRDHQLLNVAVVRWRPVETPPSLAASVLSQLLNEQLSPSTLQTSQVRSGRGWVPVAVAACMLAVLGIGVSLRSGSIDRSLARKEHDRPAPIIEHALDAPAEVASSMAAVFDDLRTEYQGLAADTTATARELAVVIPTSPAIPWGDMRMSNIASNLAVPDEQQTSGGVTAIGRSIGTQITQAMDFLWTTVPPEVPRG
ncbi:MAG: hypothetical protein JWP89_3833 [Schlesneria sp.]|nr:hypothetical protein [Schlesneria sp.]